MSTICFDIKRVDDDYVCIQHCDLNEFNYQYHLPLSFYPRKINGKEHWWLTDKYYKYVWIALEKLESGIEEIVWACNDKRWFNSAIKVFFKDKEIRVIKLPFNHVIKRVTIDDIVVPVYETTNLKDRFKIYCPVSLNEKYHIYTDHYEEDKSIEKKIGDETFMTKTYKWIPPKQLEM